MTAYDMRISDLSSDVFSSDLWQNFCNHGDYKMSHRTSTIGARILNALHDKLEQPEEACRIVRASIRKVGEDSPELAETVLDDLHLQLPYPTYACTLLSCEAGDRKSVGEGKRVEGREDTGG